MHLVPRAGLSAMALFLGGCATAEMIEVKVNASAGESAKPVQSYRIEAKTSVLDKSTLRYKEVEGYAKAMLSGKGLYEAPQPDKADIVIDLDYGISPPLLKEEMVVEQTMGSNGQVYERQGTILVTKYEKHLAMTAVENRDRAGGSSGRTVWGVDVSAEDASKDLRGYLPILIGASIDYIGVDTGHVETVRISADDPAVQFVRKGL